MHIGNSSAWYTSGIICGAVWCCCIIAAWFPAAHLVGEGYDDYAPVAEALVNVLCFFLQGQPGLVDIYMF